MEKFLKTEMLFVMMDGLDIYVILRFVLEIAMIEEVVTMEHVSAKMDGQERIANSQFA